MHDLHAHTKHTAPTLAQEVSSENPKRRMDKSITFAFVFCYCFCFLSQTLCKLQYAQDFLNTATDSANLKASAAEDERKKEMITCFA